MTNDFTAIMERDGEWYIGYCPEIPGANGQGHSEEDCLKSLDAAIELILEDLREEVLAIRPARAASAAKSLARTTLQELELD